MAPSSANRITSKRMREPGDKLLSARLPWLRPGVCERTIGGSSVQQSFATIPSRGRDGSKEFYGSGSPQLPPQNVSRTCVLCLLGLYSSCFLSCWFLLLNIEGKRFCLKHYIVGTGSDSAKDSLVFQGSP